MDLQGKVALVTGANRGIGMGCAFELARRGADVAVNYLQHSSEAEAVAEQIRALGRRAVLLQGDVAQRSGDEEMVKKTVQILGKIDILIANAATSIRKPFLELTAEEMGRVLDVSLWGVFHCSQFAAREMVARGAGGVIVIIGSVHAELPVKNSLPYNTAKAGINHMARTMAGELAGYGIRVNVVEPGWTDTPGERQYATEEQIREGATRLPLRRLATIEDVAKGVAFLVSDDASYITGASLRIDGGLVLMRGGF